MTDSQMRFDTPVSLLTQIADYAHTELMIWNMDSFTIVPSNHSRRPPPHMLLTFQYQVEVNRDTYGLVPNLQCDTCGETPLTTQEIFFT